jgi:hypothetical protein
MVDDTELELNVLEFCSKSFSFERAASVEGTEFALFHRTETESESRFRPRLVRLRIALPRAWVIYDAEEEVLRIGRDGVHPGPRASGTALEAAAERSRFPEAGLDWRRGPVPGGGFLYAPEEFADRLLSEEGLRALALA